MHRPSQPAGRCCGERQAQPGDRRPDPPHPRHGPGAGGRCAGQAWRGRPTEPRGAAGLPAAGGPAQRHPGHGARAWPGGPCAPEFLRGLLVDGIWLGVGPVTSVLPLIAAAIGGVLQPLLAASGDLQHQRGRPGRCGAGRDRPPAGPQRHELRAALHPLPRHGGRPAEGIQEPQVRPAFRGLVAAAGLAGGPAGVPGGRWITAPH